jgi:putative type II/III system pilus formation protein
VKGGEVEVEKRSWFEAARRRVVLPVIAAMLAALAGGLAASPAQAERSIQIGGSKRTATVSVYIGKSEDVRTDTSFVDITVGDPDVADVNPLTDRALSILGKKNGTTRVSVYAEGRIMLSGTAPDGPTVDKALRSGRPRLRSGHAHPRHHPPNCSITRASPT